MLDVRLADLADALCRCRVMRHLDLHEAEVLLHSSSRSGTEPAGVGPVEGCAAREKWRRQRESQVLQAIRKRLQDPAFVAALKDQSREGLLVRDASDEASAVSVGATCEAKLESNPLRTTSALPLFDTTRSHAAVCKRLSTKSVVTSNGLGLAELLEASFPCGAQSETNAGLRQLLQTASHQFRTCLWLWQRYVVLDGAPPVDVASAVEACVNEQRRTYEEQMHAVASCTAPSALPQAGGHGRDLQKSSWWRRGPEADAKWQPHMQLVVRMQACARRYICRRRCCAQLARRVSDKRLKRYQFVQQQLIPTTLRYVRQSQGVLHQYMELFYEIAKDQMALESFYETEEAEFQGQWNQYVKKMTKFFLHECPLDADWMPQSDGAGGVVFLNVKTGRTQSENPNALKVVAAKNRQLLKATRDRQERLADAQVATAAINRKKSKLVALGRQLEAPIFL